MSTSFTRIPGFTLAELLIALAILGVIATFTIPKILMSQQNSQYNATAKEVAAMIAGAYQSASLTGDLRSSFTAGSFSQYMNYLSVDTASTIDNVNEQTTSSCNTDGPCLNLHNGGKLLLWNQGFGGTNVTNAVFFQFDPDGRVTDGTTNGPGKSVKLALYYNGLITSRANILVGTTTSASSYPAQPTADPLWFQW